MTIKSCTSDYQDQCKKAIYSHVAHLVLSREYLNETDLKKWNQPAINDFYHFCHERGVLVDMNLNEGYLRLSGLKEIVQTAEMEYKDQKLKISEKSRLANLTRNVFWAHSSDGKIWVKYSNTINTCIEDAYSSQLPTVSVHMLNTLFIEKICLICSINIRTIYSCT
jgi:hypothetical protein